MAKIGSTNFTLFKKPHGFFNPFDFAICITSLENTADAELFTSARVEELFFLFYTHNLPLTFSQLRRIPYFGAEVKFSNEFFFIFFPLNSTLRDLINKSVQNCLELDLPFWNFLNPPKCPSIRLDFKLCSSLRDLAPFRMKVASLPNLDSNLKLLFFQLVDFSLSKFSSYSAYYLSSQSTCLIL